MIKIGPFLAYRSLPKVMCAVGVRGGRENTRKIELLLSLRSPRTFHVQPQFDRHALSNRVASYFW